MKAGNGSTGAQAGVLTGRWPRPGPSGLGPDGDLRLTRRQCALALASIVAGVAVPGVTHGQSLSTEPKAAPDFKPVLGQEGRDVVWIPSDDTVVQRILALAQVGPADRLVDLGSGDGRIPIAAALSAGARAVGHAVEGSDLFSPDRPAMVGSNELHRPGECRHGALRRRRRSMVWD